MINGKVLLSSWGGNGGVDSVVDALYDDLRAKGIEAEIIYNDPREIPGKTATIRRVTSSGEKLYVTFDDFLADTDFSEYAIFNPHSCNFTREQMDKLKSAAPHMPIVHSAHGLNLHVGFTEMSESPDPNHRAYIEGIYQMGSDEGWLKVKRDIGNWDACKWQEEMFKDADKIVFLTDFTRGKFRHWYPELSKGGNRELLNPNGSDFSKYASDPDVMARAMQIRQQIGDGPIIMYSGRITPPKGASDLAKAFDRIKEMYPDAKLLLVGEPHEQFGGFACIDDYIRPEFQQDVIKTGWIKDKRELAAHYAAADVMAIPSYHENFSISALEAMFMGTPVLMGDVDGSHEIYVQPQLAYGARPGNVDDMVNVFNYLFEDPARAKQNASHVQWVVNEKYTREKVIESTLGIYEQAVEEKMQSLIRECNYESAFTLAQNCPGTHNISVQGDMHSLEQVGQRLYGSLAAMDAFRENPVTKMLIAVQSAGDNNYSLALVTL